MAKAESVEKRNPVSRASGSITALLLDSKLGPKLTAIVCLVLIWAMIASFFPPAFFPGPIRIAGKIQQIFTEENFFFHMYHTLFRTTAGFLLALGIAAVLGVAMGVNRRMESLFEAPVIIGLTIPGLMWAVLALMWFGPREQAAIFSVFIITAPVVTMNLWKGTKAIDREVVEMGRAFKAGKVTIVRHIILPQVLPYIFSATRYGFAYGWKVVVISEMFGLSNGVGFQINNSFNSFSMDSVLGWTIAFVGVMLVIEYGLLKPLEDRASAWRAEIVL